MMIGRGGIAMRVMLGVGLALTLPLRVVLADTPRADVRLTADQVIYDERLDTIRAVGNVEVISDPYILRADSVIYNETSDTIVATGDVAMLDDEGNVVFGSYAEVSGDLRAAFIDGVRALLSDDSRFAAVTAERREGRYTEFERGVYSPCELCPDDPDRPPIWQLKAVRIIHDAEKKDVIYHHAFLELGGIPIAYTPYLTHPDPSVRARSGILPPQIGFDSNLGVFLRGYYYWNIDPHRDLTIEAGYVGQSGPLLGLEWRQRFAHGEIRAFGSITEGDRRSGTIQAPDVNADEIRGHLFAYGRFDLGRHWRSRFQLEVTSDDAYLREYDYSNDDVLVSLAEVEGFFGRSYTRMRGFVVDDLRPGNRPDQPRILPELLLHAVGQPVSVLGGRWSARGQLLSLTRAPGQDVHRASADLGWRREEVFGAGFLTTLTAEAASDLYWVTNRADDIGASQSDSSFIAGRWVPRASMLTRWPLARAAFGQTVLLEPMVQVILAPVVTGDVTDIPNEDSSDVELDITNLFDIDRFPGRDRVEDGPRITYGLRAGLFGQDGRISSIFLGQSYRVIDDRLFPLGSGLRDRRSDIVGRVQLAPTRFFDLDYSFRLDSETYEPRRHQVTVNGGVQAFRFYANYLYIDQVAGTGISEQRNELTAVAVARLNENWRVTGSSRTRFGGQSGQVRTGAQLIYSDDCFEISANYFRDQTDRIGDDNETSFFIRFSFKNLGAFETPNIVDELANSRD